MVASFTLQSYELSTKHQKDSVKAFNNLIFLTKNQANFIDKRERTLREGTEKVLHLKRRP